MAVEAARQLELNIKFVILLTQTYVFERMHRHKHMTVVCCSLLHTKEWEGLFRAMAG